MGLILASDGLFNQPVASLNLGDDLRVDLGVSAISVGMTAVTTSAGPHLIEVNGLLRGGNGIVAGMVGGVGAVTIRIGTTGRVEADVLAFSMGVAIHLQAADAQVSNKGAIVGIYGIVFSGAGGTTRVTNSGTIQAFDSAFFRLEETSGDTVAIYNSGNIVSTGRTLNFYGASGNVTFINTGTVKGDFTFGGGDDLYDNAKGRIVTSASAGGPVVIEGGAGLNTYRPGISAEDIVGGGAGAYDTVDFSRGPGVRMALDGSLVGTSVATGDIYRGIEQVIGSAKNDWLRADALNNQVFAGAGRDRVDGLGGNDRLGGGLGADTLYGGGGDDLFIYRSTREAGDKINDFGAALGNDDSFSILGPAFRFGAAERFVSAAEFWVTRGHHRAHDRSDRFIFDTKTATLWFDPDGTGRKGAVLLADLQAGARLSANDIWITPE